MPKRAKCRRLNGHCAVKNINNGKGRMWALEKKLPGCEPWQVVSSFAFYCRVLLEMFPKQWFQGNWAKLQLQCGHNLQPLEGLFWQYHVLPFCLFGCANVSIAPVPSVNCLSWLHSKFTCLLAATDTRSATTDTCPLFTSKIIPKAHPKLWISLQRTTNRAYFLHFDVHVCLVVLIHVYNLYRKKRRLFHQQNWLSQCIHQEILSLLKFFHSGACMLLARDDCN